MYVFLLRVLVGEFGDDWTCLHFHTVPSSGRIWKALFLLLLDGVAEGVYFFRGFFFFPSSFFFERLWEGEALFWVCLEFKYAVVDVGLGDCVDCI